MNKNDIKSNIDSLFGILKRGPESIARQFKTVKNLLDNICNSDYFAKDAADELLQKLVDLSTDTITQESDLLNIAKNIIFYEHLYRYVTGLKFGNVDYIANSIFAAICHNLKLSRYKTQALLLKAEVYADQSMLKIDEIRALEKLKSICNKHLNKLADLRSDFDAELARKEKKNDALIDKNPMTVFADDSRLLDTTPDRTKISDIDKRITILRNMQNSLTAKPDFSDAKQEKLLVTPYTGILQSRINTFREQFGKYQEQVISSQGDSKIAAADIGFIAKVRQVFSTISVKIIGFFSKQYNSDRVDAEFTADITASIALTA